MSNFSPSEPLLGTPPDQNSRGSGLFLDMIGGRKETDKNRLFKRNLYLLRAQDLCMPDDCSYVWFHHIYSRKICIVRHWILRQKSSIHSSRLCLVFTARLAFGRICPLICALMCFCLYFRVYICSASFRAFCGLLWLWLNMASPGIFRFYRGGWGYMSLF